MTRGKILILLALCGFLTVRQLQADDAVRHTDDDRLAVTIYESLEPLALSERRDLFLDLPGPIQTRLWIVHLETYLTNHPALDAGQRAVITDGIALLRTGYFELAEDEWYSRAQPAAEALLARAKAAFRREEIRAAFGTLGPLPRQKRVTSDIDGRWKPIGNPIIQQPDCECSTKDDWCWGSAFCKGGSGCRWSSWGCGWYWSEPCDGMCQEIYTPPPQ